MSQSVDLDTLRLTAGQSYAFDHPNNLPEPGSMALAGLALAGVIATRRRRG